MRHWFDLTLLGIFIHAVLLYSIFDVYYTSPLVDGTDVHPITHGKGLADRIVIFSADLSHHDPDVQQLQLQFADGLRADSFFNHPDKSPFLHGIIRQNKSFWGVSVSHVPTESRPGHVAMLAGFYEDVSAVARGWRYNPVPFDSIINRSRVAWAWGSADIVSMFTDKVKHAIAEVYSSSQDFQGKDAALLDQWVFDQVDKFFKNSTGFKRERLRWNQAVFFLHLLGLDTNGHGRKPHSVEYVENIALVDRGVANVTNSFEAFYKDNRTAYLFTADHGMTDWGSHGAGTEAELVIPLVVWGSGVRPSSIRSRIDQFQIDLSPLMSALLGIPIPKNSIGTVPAHVLASSPRYRFQSVYANFKQILEQYIIKKHEKKSHAFPFMFYDFADLRPSVLSSIENEIKRLTTVNRFEAATAMCLQWIPVIRSGLLHFHRHDRRLLGIAIGSTFFSWIILVYSFATRQRTKATNIRPFTPSTKAFCLIGASFALLMLNGLPFAHSFYVSLPMYLSYLCYELNTSENNLSKSISSWFYLFWKPETREYTCRMVLKAAVIVLCISVLIVTLVSAFHYRVVLSLEFLLLGLIIFFKTASVNRRIIIWFVLVVVLPRTAIEVRKRLWFICCVLIAIFPLFPVVGQTPLSALCIISSLTSSCFLLCIADLPQLRAAKKLVLCHVLLHFIAAVVLILVDICAQEGYVLLLLRSYCWSSIPVAAISPLFAPQNVGTRLVIWFSSLMLPYSLLSLSYESLFLLIFFMLLFVYVRLQFAHLSDDEFLALSLAKQFDYAPLKSEIGTLKASDWNEGIVLVVMIEAAFFGTGNVASINSFNPSFLRCFISLFSPFIMAAMLIAKISLPFLAVGFAYAAALRLQNALIVKRSLVLLIITDAMAMIFFFRLKDEGSWLDIGTSISHYVISMAVSVIVYLLLHLTFFLLPLSLNGSTLEDACNVNIPLRRIFM